MIYENPCTEDEKSLVVKSEHTTFIIDGEIFQGYEIVKYYGDTININQKLVEIFIPIRHSFLKKYI